MKLLLPIAVASAVFAVQGLAYADSMAPALTRAEVQAQLTQAYLHDTRAVDEPNTYPNPNDDRHFVARNRQKASGMSTVASH
jgi:hypothetical protein